MYRVEIERTDAAPTPDKPGHFHYVDQGNYLCLPVEGPVSLYSDSATSCIITVVFGTRDGRTEVTLAHLDSPSCIEAFFRIVAGRGYTELQVFAQGANPPDNATSKENAEAFRAEIHRLQPARSELFLEEGDPRQDNRGDFGVVATVDGAVVTNRQYVLELTERDPTCGGQTVYCIMRRQERPPVELRDAGQPFTHAELVQLSQIALAFQKDPKDPSTRFTAIVTLDSEAVRENWSTTPEYEAPWFSDQLKLGAVFALSMAPVVQLSADTLEQSGAFTRLAKALAR